MLAYRRQTDLVNYLDRNLRGFTKTTLNLSMDLLEPGITELVVTHQSHRNVISIELVYLITDHFWLNPEQGGKETAMDKLAVSRYEKVVGPSYDLSQMR